MLFKTEIKVNLADGIVLSEVYTPPLPCAIDYLYMTPCASEYYSFY